MFPVVEPQNIFQKFVLHYYKHMVKKLKNFKTGNNPDREFESRIEILKYVLTKYKCAHLMNFIHENK